MKTKRLKNLAETVMEEFDGDLERLFGLGQHGLRARLLQVNGIGPETADCIVLYAATFPTFVVDNYTARVAKRHGWVEMEADYHRIQDEFHTSLPEDQQLFNDYHALIVRVGKEFCGRKPKCATCPLADMLPEGAPLEFDK